VLTEEKLDDIGVRLEHTPRKSLKRLAQETGVSTSKICISHFQAVLSVVNRRRKILGMVSERLCYCPHYMYIYAGFL
jgi:hypothetical protein